MNAIVRRVVRDSIDGLPPSISVAGPVTCALAPTDIASPGRFTYRDFADKPPDCPPWIAGSEPDQRCLVQTKDVGDRRRWLTVSKRSRPRQPGLMSAADPVRSDRSVARAPPSPAGRGYRPPTSHRQ